MRSAQHMSAVHRFGRMIILLCITAELFAPENKSYGQTNPFFYEVGFQQNLNSYSWRSQLRYDRAIFGTGALSLQENFRSSLIRLSGDDHKWKDDQQFNLKLSIPIRSVWGARLSASANNFTDRLSGLVTDIQTNWAKLGTYWQPSPRTMLTADLGYINDDRLTRIDQGVTHNFQFKTDSLVFNDYQNRLYFFNRSDQFAVRRNSDLEFSYNVKKYFQYGTMDSLSILWSRLRRDNYDPIEIDKPLIETLSEENRGFQNNLVYGIQRHLFLGINSRINQRISSVAKQLKQQTLDERSRKDFQSENEIAISVDHHFMIANVAVKYETNSQKNDVPDSLKSKKFSKYFYYISPDFQSSRLTLSTMSKFYLFASDSLQLNASISRFQYDTPENNMDDRDEFRLILSLSEIHPFARNLVLVVNGSVNLYHLVYIFSERSANNNWMRIFRIYPQVIFRPNHKIALAQHFEVLANYVDYDYETGTTTAELKSYIFRRFSFTQQIQAQLSKRTDMFLNYRLELEENGKLAWDRWTEYLLMNRTNHWLRFIMNYQLKRHFTLSPGFIVQHRAERRNNLASSPGGYLASGGNTKSFGPTCKLSYQPHHRLHFSLEAMRRAVTMTSEQTQFINHIDLNLTWYH